MDNKTNDFVPGLLDAQELKTVGPKMARANPLMGLLGEIMNPPALNVGATPDMDAAFAAQDRMNFKNTTQEPIAYRTSDGYTFFLQEDGNLTDNVDPEKSDMIFDSIEQIEQEMGEPLLPLGPNANELDRFKQSQWMQGWLNFMEGPLDETEKYIRALNKQRRAKSRADLRLID